MAGYLWQLQRAFLTLIDGTFGDTLQVETVDDIAIVRDGICISAAQTKHSLNESSLTTRSPEWWATIRVWLDLHSSGLLPPRTELLLCTTAYLSDEMQSFLRERSDAELHHLLGLHDAIAAEASNSTLTKAYSAWSSATQETRSSILKRISIASSQLHLSECTSEIDLQLRRCGISEGYPLSVARERLMGWFQNAVATRLTAGGCEITYQEFNDFLCEVRDELSPHMLFSRHADAPTPDLIAERQKDPTYLRQLDLLKASDQELASAVSMYHRAVLERAHWLNTKITAPSILQTYDQDLANAWTQKRDQVERLQATDDEVIRGWRLYYLCLDYRGSINGQHTPTHVANGTFHILANQPPSNPTIGWHPHYSTLLSTSA